MQLRFADRYEVRRMDKWNWAVYRVMPEGFDNSKAKYQLSDDGRAIRHTGTYHGTPAAAIRAALRLLEDEAIECPDARSMAEALERFEAEASALADRIGEAAQMLEAAR